MMLLLELIFYLGAWLLMYLCAGFLFMIYMLIFHFKKCKEPKWWQFPILTLWLWPVSLYLVVKGEL